MEIIKAFYFILPAYIANMAPVIASRYNWPFAQSLSVKHFGKNKTYRGFIFGYIAALLFIIAQKHANIEYLNIINYYEANLFLIAFLMSFGALGGDLSGDLHLFVPKRDKPLICEVKGRKTEPAKTLIKWKKDSDILIVKVDKQPPYFVLDEETMRLLLEKDDS